MNRSFLPYSRQSIDESDIQAVADVLRSDYVTQGPVVKEFEKAIADFCGCRHTVVLASGSAALHAACHALGVSQGSEVLVPNNTFAATANAVVHCGGRPVFVDSDRGLFHLSQDDLVGRTTDMTVGLIPVHYGGMPCDMKAISGFARSRNLWVIEDATHAMGASYDGSPVGCCRHSDAAVFSFHPVKTLCAGEGGAILTNSDDIEKKVRQFVSGGITKDASCFKHPDAAAPWYAEMHFPGFNFRITEMQSALGLSQLKRLPSFIEKRNAVAKAYCGILGGRQGIEMPLEGPGYSAYCAYHLFPVLIDYAKFGTTRTAVFEFLKGNRIGTQVHYIPLARHPYFQDAYGCRPAEYPNSEDVYGKALSLPISAIMDDGDVEYVCENLFKALNVR